MTTPKEALEQIAARSIAQDDDDEKELRRQLYHIEALAKSALASIQGEDAVERVARIKSLLVSFHRNSCYPEAMTGELNDAAERILATGLVPDEAAIRADEREKCAKVAEAEYADKNWHAMYRHAAGAIAAAIRGGRS